MTLTDLPKMLISETHGWRDIDQMHPSVTRLLLAVAGPLSLLPPLMYFYASTAHPGAIFPMLAPALGMGEAFVVGGVFFLVELAMVFMMADVIRQIARTMETKHTYAQCFSLAAIAPVPLWLTSMMLFIPSMAFNVLMLAIAWIGTAALIRHGVRTLLHVADESAAHRMSNRITFAGVAAWIGLMVVMSLVLSMVLGWR